MSSRKQTGSLQGKRVVVMGGTAGLGLATAHAAAAAGGDVVVASSRESKVSEVLGELPAGTVGETVDVRDEAAVQAFFARIGPFDHLVYTAGEPMTPAPVLETDISAVREFFEIRFWGAYASIKYGAPHIRPGGSIVLSSGGASQRPGPGWAAAASALGAMEALGRALAVELAPIRVNVVRPGMVRTEMWRAYPDEVLAEMFDSVGKSLPVGRIGASVDIARTYVHLMEQEYATGSIVTVDGGGLLV